ncbi:glycosyltransferase family 1 protein [Chryseobacterium sp. KACC 21268]|nr:glycosyltransferase family 1 protein [Chryseobacterium sp. KACC 21268]
MKVLIDHQIFQNQKFGGISRYFFELMEGFRKSNVDFDLSLLYSNNEYIKGFENIQSESIHSAGYNDFLFGKEFRGKAFLYNQYKKTQPKVPSFRQQNLDHTISKLKKGDFDIFHTTYYDDYFLDHLNGKPFVITVYDLIHQIYPEYFPLNIVDKNYNILDKASKIIAISESTKNDLIDFYGLPAEKIDVTYLASSLDAGSEANNISNLPEKYILFVGNRTIYKNFYFFAEVLSRVLDNHPDIELVCTGSKFSKEEEFFIKKLGLQNRIKNYFVNDAELIMLYQKALFFAFPSMYEGFGIPILEAYENDCPVLLARNSSLEEIGGDAAHYFSSKSIKSLEKSLEQLISNQHLRTTLIEKGKLRLQDFSWKKTTEQTIKIYKEAINAAQR